MKGLEISRGYYREFGAPMIERTFPHLVPYIAVGLVGAGSERYGFDDDISRDHDFEPGFCIFIPGEDVVSRRDEFELQRAYDSLPAVYCGAERQTLSPVGGRRSGVIRTADFYRAAVGEPDGVLTVGEWLTIPDYALAEAVNGEVFCDNYGEFSRIRASLSAMPRDIMLKRLAGNLLVMAQAGQYNCPRSLRRGDRDAAHLAAVEFVTAAMRCAFLLAGKYMPYYKWSFRALREIPSAAALADKLSRILAFDGDAVNIIDDVCTDTAKTVNDAKITVFDGNELEMLAYRVNNTVSDAEIRNLHILSGVR